MIDTSFGILASTKKTRTVHINSQVSHHYSHLKCANNYRLSQYIFCFCVLVHMMMLNLLSLNVFDEINDTVGITIFVVVPRNKLNELRAQHDSSTSVED